MIRLVVAARARRWWRAWLAIAVLVSIIGGAVLASAAAARRTQAALPQFVSAYGADVAAFALRPVPVPKVAGLPGVESARQVILPNSAPAACRGCRGPARPLALQVLSPLPDGRAGWKLLSGHWPDPGDPRQVLASFTLRDDFGVHPGTVFRVPFYAPAQLHALDRRGGPPAPRGPVVSFVVTGIAAALQEFPAGAAPVHDLVTTPAFARLVLPRTAAVYQYPIRLRGGPAGLGQFGAALQTRAGRHLAGYLNLAEQVAAVTAAIHPQVIGWWLLAALAALVGLAVVGQALARQGAAESESSAALAALGATRGQLATISLAGTAMLALAGAAGAVAVAVALSPLAPVGVARIAETSAGTVLLGLWPAWRAGLAARTGRRPEPARPSAVAGWLATAGAPPAMLVGVRQALQRRAADGSAPVGTALLGTVLAVTALTATTVFGASLSHLLATPALYGQQFQLDFSDNGGPTDGRLLRELTQDPAVTGISRGADVTTTINAVPVEGLAGRSVRGGLL